MIDQHSESKEVKVNKTEWGGGDGICDYDVIWSMMVLITPADPPSHCLHLLHFPLHVLIPVWLISFPEPHRSLSVISKHLTLVQGRLLNNREAILIKHMIVGDGDEGSGGFKGKGMCERQKR